LDVEVNQTMTRDLVEHVVKETNAGRELGLTRTVEVDLDGDLGLIGISGYFGLSHKTLLDL
jgi:hypothetical protein